MGQTIVKLKHEGQDYYLLWSSIVDAPVTYGLSLEELEDYLREEEGARYMRDTHPMRMERVQKRGHSSYMDANCESGEEFVRHQIHQGRANKLPDDDPGGWWTVEEVIRDYIVRRPVEDDGEED
jgi:hypothetical protein